MSNAVELDQLRESALRDEEDSDNEEYQKKQQQQKTSSQNSQERQEEKEKQQEEEEEDRKKKQKEIPEVPCDRYFFEASKRCGVDPSLAFAPNPEVKLPTKPKHPKNQQQQQSSAAASSNSSPRRQAQQQYHSQHPQRRLIVRPASSTSTTSSSRPSSRASSVSSVDSVAAVSTLHSAGARQERKLRDLLAVLTERNDMMKSKARDISRQVRFKRKIKQKARALQSNKCLQNAYQHELAVRQQIKKRATNNSSKNEKKRSGSSRNNNNNSNDNDEEEEEEEDDDDDEFPEGTVFSGTALGELGKDGEDAFFEQALRQRQVWDLREMRQQRARDRRQAEYSVRLQQAESYAAQEWKKHDEKGDQAKLICRTNHALVKSRRERDEAHIAAVEARFAAIDKKRSKEYRDHLKEIETARQRRDGVMKTIADSRVAHEEHADKVQDNRSRQAVEKNALIQNSLDQLESQRTRHEFLRFVRDVELANRSLAERDHMLVVVSKSESMLEQKRKKYMEGFSKTEAAVERVEKEIAEKAKDHADRREQRHFEARTARIANEEELALQRLGKAQREADARRRKQRADARKHALTNSKFEQKKQDQEERVEKMTQKMMNRREEILGNASRRQGNVEGRKDLVHGIRTVKGNALVEL